MPESAPDTQPAPAGDVWTADDVAAYLNLDPAQVRRLARSRKLPGAKIGGAWRFNRAAIIALLPVAV